MCYAGTGITLASECYICKGPIDKGHGFSRGPTLMLRHKRLGFTYVRAWGAATQHQPSSKTQHPLKRGGRGPETNVEYPIRANYGKVRIYMAFIFRSRKARPQFVGSADPREYTIIVGVYSGSTIDC